MYNGTLDQVFVRYQQRRRAMAEWPNAPYRQRGDDGGPV